MKCSDNFNKSTINPATLKIINKLSGLSAKEIPEISGEVREYMLDVKAQEIHDAVQRGEIKTHDFDEVISGLTH